MNLYENFVWRTWQSFKLGFCSVCLVAREVGLVYFSGHVIQSLILLPLPPPRNELDNKKLFKVNRRQGKISLCVIQTPTKIKVTDRKKINYSIGMQYFCRFSTLDKIICIFSIGGQITDRKKKFSNTQKIYASFPLRRNKINTKTDWPGRLAGCSNWATWLKQKTIVTQTGGKS